MYYKVCPYCGASLDPGETCDCRKHKSVYKVGDEVECTTWGKYNGSKGVIASEPIMIQERKYYKVTLNNGQSIYLHIRGIKHI